MARIKRELKNIAISAKITKSTKTKLVKKCEKEGVSVSEYINRLIKDDLDLK